MTKGSSSGWARQIAVAIDQLFNALFGGDARWTLSARFWACRNDRTAFGAISRLMVPLLSRVLGEGHCERAWEKMEALDRGDLGAG